MPTVNVSYGAKTRTVDVPSGAGLGEAIAATELPLEQPCAGRGTCGKCRVLVEQEPAGPGLGLSALDEVEQQLLSPAEQTAGYRLACRASVLGDVSVVLAPVIVYSNKMFRASDRFRNTGEPLGLAVDLGSTTVAAFLVNLATGEVCRGAAALNQQTTYGADVISRLAASRRDPVARERLANLALASIVQAVDALRLPRKALARIQQATIVGNTAMHHLLLRLSVDTLAELPFPPNSHWICRPSSAALSAAMPWPVWPTLTTQTGPRPVAPRPKWLLTWEPTVRSWSPMESACW
ncbi:MAG: 2Fe-2S iron-sulfur cluster binding domain-containing protein [Anaerolineae bacterium]|nr:2Fe-2S iron-sulfur cluster binding domain-containing protein [Anaerolineae bacterium]